MYNYVIYYYRKNTKGTIIEKNTKGTIIETNTKGKSYFDVHANIQS
jgi:hypothetical protein